jgi:hypothetical protein
MIARPGDWLDQLERNCLLQTLVFYAVKQQHQLNDNHKSVADMYNHTTRHKTIVCKQYKVHRRTQRFVLAAVLRILLM